MTSNTTVIVVSTLRYPALDIKRA